MNQNLTISQNYVSTLRNLKIGIWIYFILVIFEGALRKWFLPDLAVPLLVVRDPVAFWLIYISWKHGLLPSNVYLLGMAFIGVLGTITALLFGHGSLPVVIFGARLMLIHFPIMFVMGAVLAREDVIRIGKALLYISLPMVLLIALQFYSPQSAWVNRGVGGDMEGAGFSGALGYFRPPGTFSFTNGNTLFFSLVACYVFYFWLAKSNINRILLLGATAALLVSVPLSISRTLLFSIGITFVFSFVASILKPQMLPKIMGVLLTGVLLTIALGRTAFFQTATEAFTTRLELATKVEGGFSSSVTDRFFGGMITDISSSGELPFFGYGLGMGTNAGSALLTGERAFLIAEGEWLRLIGELGFVMGIATILIRLVFCGHIFFKGLNRLRSGDLLPWMLLSFGLLIISQGQWGQPTTLGFSTLVGGLILASVNKI